MKLALCIIMLSVASYAQQPMKFKMSNAPAKGNPAANKTNSTSTSTSTSIAPLSATSSSLKKDSLSTSNFFPAKGVKALTFKPAYNNLTTSSDLKNSKSSTELTGLVTQINFATRVSNNVALEFYTDIGSQDATITTRSKLTNQSQKINSKQTGMGDLHLAAKTKKAQGNGDLYGGIDLGLSPGSSEIGSQRSDGNRFSGGQSVTPSVSYEQMYRARVVGFKAALALFADRALEQRSNNQTEKATLSGGHTISLSAFNEWNTRRMNVGVAGQLDLVGQGALEPTGQKAIDVDPSQLLNLSLYGDAAISQRLSLLPSLSFRTLLNRGQASLDGYDEITMGLAARIGL